MSGKDLSGRGCEVKKQTNKQKKTTSTQEMLFICLIVTLDLTVLQPFMSLLFKTRSIERSALIQGGLTQRAGICKAGVSLGDTSGPFPSPLH